MKLSAVSIFAALTTPLLANALSIPQSFTAGQLGRRPSLDGKAHSAKQFHTRLRNVKAFKTEAHAPNTDTLDFDDIQTKDDLIPLNSHPYKGLTFSSHFMVANASESLIPSALSPASPPNLALVLTTDDGVRPTIQASGTRGFAIRSLSIQPIFPEDVKGPVEYTVCLIEFQAGGAWDDECMRARDEQDGMEKITFEMEEFAERVEFEVYQEEFGGGKFLTFAIDELVVEWKGEEDTTRSSL